MKIALIFTPSIYQTKETMPPLGLAWLAAVLQKNGFNDVYIIDSVINKYDNQKIIELLKEQGADLIGLSFGTQNRFYAFQLAELIKKNFPSVPLVAGGPHVTLTADDTLRQIQSIDIIVRGEGEFTFLELIQAIERGNDIRMINGLSYRNSQGEIFHNTERTPIIDLDVLPFPARELLPIKNYQQKIPLSDKICTSMITSRGCPNNCIYCSTASQWGHNIRFRSPKNIVDEIEIIVNKYGLEGVGFFDDCFTVDKKRVIAICQEIINRGLKIGWWCEARANTLDPEVLAWMKRAGCEYIAMAIESGSNEVLKRIKKMITVEQGIAAAKMIHAVGIKQKIFFMHGLPGETYEDIKKTVFLSRYLLDRVGVEEATQGVTIIYPHTEIETIAKELNILPQDFSWSRIFHEPRSYPPLIVSQNMPIFEQPNLSYENIFQFARRAKMEYYLSHPLFLARKLWKHRDNITKWFTTRTV
ncbi:MAG: radical SAM protein [Patescibacteria group bacterium]|jgi:radical SAM superfamily enzyme YgiQ (UPF0313 family)